MEIYKALSCTEDELFIDLGKSVVAGRVGLGEVSEDELKNRGSHWFNEFINQNRRKICESNVVVIYRSNPGKWDDAILVAAIADLITGLIISASPVTAAVLITRKGIDRVCK